MSSAIASSVRDVAKFAMINYQPVRHRLWANKRPIMGWPRKHLYNNLKKYPEPHIYNWRPYLPEDGLYTINPLPIFKMGGRDLETGRVVVRTLGGGNPKKFRWPDMYRKSNEDGTPLEERVLMIRYDPLHTPKLALVAGPERQRWIFASQGVEVGDIIRTYSTEIPRNPVRAKNGDAHPIGALAVGTKINCLERDPGEGAKFCLAAGSSAEIVKRSPDSVTVKLSHGDQLKLESTCMAVVGEMSNVGHNLVHLLCPQRRRWLGKRPKSGQWRAKDGYCGRKNHPEKFIDLTMAAIMEKRQKEAETNLYDLSG